MPHCKSIDERNRQRKNNYDQTRGGYKSGKRWSYKDEENLLCSRSTDRQLSKLIGRSVQAIQLKRVRMNDE
jgi:hypothetical protein